MNLAPLEQINNLVTADRQTSKTDALRQAARQFEAILLTQLTSALNGTNDDEDSLFGGDGGSALAKQLFSEQLATTMADSGGVGLSDLILQQFGANSSKNSIGKSGLAGVASTVKEIKSGEVSDYKNSAPAINKNAKFEPPDNNFSVNSNDLEIISTLEDEIRLNPDDEVSRYKLNGEFLSTTRPRIVPNHALEENKINSSANNFPAAAVDRMNFQMPVKGRISSGFGNRVHPIDKIVKFHAGIDIAAPKGTPIGAAAEGVVTFAGWRKGYGNLVIVRHADGRETRYGHAEKIFVKEGDEVFAGKPVALVGSTGKSTGPHLHFEVRENGSPVNPRDFLSNVLLKNADR